MKGTNLVLMMMVLLLGFACAEVNDSNSSFGNDTIVINETAEANETVVMNETTEINETVEVNDTIVINESVEVALDGHDSGEPNEIVVVNEAVEEVGVDDIVVESEGVIEDKDSAFDAVVSYVSGVIDKINSVQENLFLVLLIVLWVLLLFLHSVFYGKKSASAYFAKASSFHRRAQKAHVNGDYVKAKKLYSKSYSLREEGEKKADLEL